MGARDVVLDAPPHRARRLDEPLAFGRAPHVGVGCLLEGATKLIVAGAGAGLEQRLKLPGLRPLLPVAPIGLDRAHERAISPLGPQVGIHRPQGGFVSGPRARRGRGGGEPGGDLQCFPFFLPHLPPGHVQDIHIRDVVQFARPGLAHGNDRDGNLPPRVDVAPGEGEGPLKRRVNKIGDATPHRGHHSFGILARQVVGGQV